MEKEMESTWASQPMILRLVCLNLNSLSRVSVCASQHKLCLWTRCTLGKVPDLQSGWGTLPSMNLFTHTHRTASVAPRIARHFSLDIVQANKDAYAQSFSCGGERAIRSQLQLRWDLAKPPRAWLASWQLPAHLTRQRLLRCHKLCTAEQKPKLIHSMVERHASP